MCEAGDGTFLLEFTARGPECANTSLELSSYCEHRDLAKDRFLGAEVPQGYSLDLFFISGNLLLTGSKCWNHFGKETICHKFCVLQLFVQYFSSVFFPKVLFLQAILKTRCFFFSNLIVIMDLLIKNKCNKAE